MFIRCSVFDVCRSVEVFDPEKGQWETERPLNEPRSFMGSCVGLGKIWAGGGQNSHGPLTSVEAFDPSTRRWTTVGHMQTARKAFGMAEAHGRLYFIGGKGNTALSFADSVETWEPRTGAWSVACNAQARVFFGLAVA